MSKQCLLCSLYEPAFFENLDFRITIFNYLYFRDAFLKTFILQKSMEELKER